MYALGNEAQRREKARRCVGTDGDSDGCQRDIPVGGGTLHLAHGESRGGAAAAATAATNADRAVYSRRVRPRDKDSADFAANHDHGDVLSD